MRWIMRLVSALTNPLFVPYYFILWYSFYDPFSSQKVLSLQKSMTLYIAVGTPLLLYTVLKYFKLVTSIHLPTARQRIIPIGIYIVLLMILIRFVFSQQPSSVKYIFFVAFTFTQFVAMIASVINYKISLHLIGMGNLLGLMLSLQYYQAIPLIGSLIFLLIASGCSASSRLYLNAHNGYQLISGFLIGVGTQLAFSYYVASLVVN